jgi:hypothetical protein
MESSAPPFSRLNHRFPLKEQGYKSGGVHPALQRDFQMHLKKCGLEVTLVSFKSEPPTVLNFVD